MPALIPTHSQTACWSGEPTTQGTATSFAMEVEGRRGRAGRAMAENTAP